MTTKKKIEVFSAGCSTCKETIELVKRIAGPSHELVIHDMQQPDVASKAKHYDVRSVPAIVVDGKLAGAAQAVAPMSMSCDLLSRRHLPVSLLASSGSLPV